MRASRADTSVQITPAATMATISRRRDDRQAYCASALRQRMASSFIARMSSAILTAVPIRARKWLAGRSRLGGVAASSACQEGRRSRKVFSSWRVINSSPGTERFSDSRRKLFSKFVAPRGKAAVAASSSACSASATAACICKPAFFISSAATMLLRGRSMIASMERLRLERRNSA